MRFRFGFYTALGFLIVLSIGAVFADKIAPYPPNYENRANAFHPPTTPRFFDESGKFSLRPYVYGTQSAFEANMRRVYRPQKSKCYLRRSSKTLLSVQSPGNLYMFGTDSRGRDIFSRILYGTRVSLSMGLLGAGIVVLIGFFVGAATGYFGGWLDQVLMRLAELFMMIPALYLLLALRGSLPPTMTPENVYFLMVLVLSIAGWGAVARVVRGMTLSMREREFILAARVLGRRTFEILRGHILPHVFGYLLIVMSVSVSGFIFAEAVLSALGLGIQEPAISLGNMLTDAMSYSMTRYHPWLLAPGGVIFLIALSLNIISDRLKDNTRKDDFKEVEVNG